MAQDIADDRWRLHRGRAIEENRFSLGIDAKSIALLGLYVNRIDRAIARKLKLLRQLQAARQAALQKAAEEANLLAELAESKSESYDVERDFPGFGLGEAAEVGGVAA